MYGAMFYMYVCTGLFTCIYMYIHIHMYTVRTYRYTHVLTGTGMYRCLHARLCSVHLQVPSHKSARVKVQYAANHLQPSTATLLLVPRGGRGSSGTAMAFTLKGTVTGAKPQVQCTLGTYMYTHVHACSLGRWMYMYMYIHTYMYVIYYKQRDRLIRVFGVLLHVAYYTTRYHKAY